MELREYQKEAAKALRKAREAGARALVVMATGLGKTTIAAWDLLDFITGTPGNVRVLYLVHINNILYQSLSNIRKMTELPPEEFGIFNGTTREADRNFVFATFQTMSRYLADFRPDDFDYIIVDEAHHVGAETYDAVVQFFQPKFLLGLTATPFREDGKLLDRWFGPPIVDIPLHEAMVRGYLAPVNYVAITNNLVEVAINDPEVNRAATRGELNRVVFIPKHDIEVVRVIEEKLVAYNVDNPRIIIFCSNTKHVHQFAKALADNIAFEFRILHSRSGDSDELERRYLDEFRNGTINTLLVINKLNEGVDLPEANVVIFLRSTESDVIFTQQLGRGLRHVEGKRLLALDFVDNHQHLERVRTLHTHVSSSKATRVHGMMLVETESVFEFDAKTLEAFELVDRFRKRKTRMSILEQIVWLRRHLHHTPSMRDWAEHAAELGFASMSAIVKEFGSWRRAVNTAGFSVRTGGRLYNQGEIFEQIEIMRQWLRRPPSIEDMMQLSTMRRSWMFGTLEETEAVWRHFLSVAGYIKEEEVDS